MYGTPNVTVRLKFEIFRYGEREYGRTDVRLTADVYGVLPTSISRKRFVGFT